MKDFFAAGLFGAHQIEGMPHFGQLEVRGCGADRDGVADTVKLDLLGLRPFFRRVLLSFQHWIEHALRVVHLEDGWGLASWQRWKAVGIGGAGTCVQVRQEGGPVYPRLA